MRGHRCLHQHKHGRHGISLCPAVIGGLVSQWKEPWEFMKAAEHHELDSLPARDESHLDALLVEARSYCLQDADRCQGTLSMWLEISLPGIQTSVFVRPQRLHIRMSLAHSHQLTDSCTSNSRGVVKNAIGRRLHCEMTKRVSAVRGSVEAVCVAENATFPRCISNTRSMEAGGVVKNITFPRYINICKIVCPPGSKTWQFSQSCFCYFEPVFINQASMPPA